MKYVGNDRFVPGIPATDLDDEEIAALAKKRDKTPAALRKELSDSGLYAERKPEKESKS